MGHFFPPGFGSGYGFRIRIRIRIHWPDWIRIQSGSGSETLLSVKERKNLTETCDLQFIITCTVYSTQRSVLGYFDCSVYSILPVLSSMNGSVVSLQYLRKLFNPCWQPVLRIRIRDPVPFWPLDPGNGMVFFRISDPESNPQPIFFTACRHFLDKNRKYFNSLSWQLAQISFSTSSKINEFSIM